MSTLTDLMTEEIGVENEFGNWLRKQREERGWTRPEMARKLIQEGHSRGDKTMPGIDSVRHNIFRWERGAGTMSERYRVYYCRIFGIPLSQFGPRAPVSPQHPAFPAAPAPVPDVLTGTVVPLFPSAPPVPPAHSMGTNPDSAQLLPPDVLAYRGTQAPEMGGPTVQHEVLMAAHEGSEFAGHAEERAIGDMTLEQLRADVVRLSRGYMTGEPLALFLEMRRVRARMHEALDRRMWPRDATELYFLLGCINDLMAVAALDLGYPQATEELLRTGWAYAVAIDCRPLMANLRVQAATALYWDEPARSRELALDGTRHLSGGPNAAYIHLKHGRAAARLGDTETARAAIDEATAARERTNERPDDMLDIGGEFNFSRASQHYLAGATLVELPGAERDAAAELEQAIDLYQAGPEPGEDHSQKSVMITHIDLATVRLRTGQVEEAAAALTPVLTLPPALRISAFAQRLGRTRAELASPIYRGSPLASDLEAQVEEFGREMATTGLRTLTPGPS